MAGGRWVEEAGPVTRWQGDTSLLQTMLMILLRLRHNRAPDNQHYTPRSQGAQTNSKGGKTKSARKPRLRRRLGNFREQNSFNFLTYNCDKVSVEWTMQWTDCLDDKF